MNETRLPPRSRLDASLRTSAFHWAVGVEDTFIVDPWPATGRTLDEYELTGHYDRWRDDVDRMAALGVRCARWGVPWHRVNPARGRWRWGWTDRVVEHALRRGVEPIVDLVHYGTPRWMPHGFLDPDFPQRMAEYAARVADRYRGRLRWYTPLNEPRIAAWYGGRLGWWPPYRAAWRGFVAVLVAACRGVAATETALRGVDSEIVCVHVDAGDLFATDDPALRVEARRRQQLVFLALDLLTGRVGARHPLRRWLAAHGVGEDVLAEFAARPLRPDVIGVNLYPMFTAKRLFRRGGTLRIAMPFASPTLVDRMVGMYWRRYRRPVMVTETAAIGRRRAAWLDGSVAAVRRMRARGVPVVGYTWWPLFSLVAWGYRQGQRPLERHLLHMGLWDLGNDLSRRPTAMVERFRRMVAAGTTAVGPLAAG